MNRRLLAAQLRRALQRYAMTVTDESVMMEMASLYPDYEARRAYRAGEVLKWGVNGDGEPQLYRALQDHISAEEWTPDTATGLYKAVGIAPDGLSLWTRPLGAADAYRLGDRVRHGDGIWVCTQADAAGNNLWEPGVYGWEQEANP